MKPLIVAGIVLLLIGVVSLGYQGFTYTTRETIVDIGPIHATADREKTVALPRGIGIVAVIAGAAMLFTGARKRA
jgi:hypothetical protein